MPSKDPCFKNTPSEAQNFCSTSHFEIPSRIIWSDVVGQLALLDSESGNYFGLDETGSAIWRNLTEGKNVETIVDSLMQRYEGDFDSITRDVIDLLTQLLDSHLINKLEEHPEQSVT